LFTACHARIGAGYRANDHHAGHDIQGRPLIKAWPGHSPRLCGLTTSAGRGSSLLNAVDHGREWVQTAAPAAHPSL